MASMTVNPGRTTMSKREPAVTYYRMSTDKQEKSIEDERIEVERMAAREGYSILRDYVDEAISGDDTRKRKAFQQMIRDATDKRDFRFILCWDRKRFGRFHSVEAGYWISPLVQAGVQIHT